MNTSESADQVDGGALAAAVRSEAVTTRQASPLAPEVLAATVSWLRARSDASATRRAYTADLAEWLDFCIDQGLDPLRAGPADLARWSSQLATVQRPATRRVLASASRARTLAAVSSWYHYLVVTGLAVDNPVTVARPVVGRNRGTHGRSGDSAARLGDSAARLGGGLAPEHAAALFATAAAATGPAAARNQVVIRLLAQVGMPLRDVVAADVGGYVREPGTGPGRICVVSRTGTPATRPLPDDAADVLERYLAARAAREGARVADLTGPLLATATGRRLDQPAVFRLVRRLARAAGLPDADQLSPNALRRRPLRDPPHGEDVTK